ncbi:Gustatory receptor [Balamuthia mandrillaris]
MIQQLLLEEAYQLQNVGEDAVRAACGRSAEALMQVLLPAFFHYPPSLLYCLMLPSFFLLLSLCSLILFQCHLCFYPPSLLYCLMLPSVSLALLSSLRLFFSFSSSFSPPLLIIFSHSPSMLCLFCFFASWDSASMKEEAMEATNTNKATHAGRS